MDHVKDLGYNNQQKVIFPIVKKLLSITALLLLIEFFFLPSEIFAQEEFLQVLKIQNSQTANSENFVTIINPVRSRSLWNDKSTKQVNEQIQILHSKHIPSTWLLQYDNLNDPEVINLFKNKELIETGAFMEVSEKWATDSHVNYKTSDGDYYRPDKVFLSGYSPEQRTSLINTYFKKYKSIFGTYPKVTGAWYIDSISLSLLAKKGVVSNLILSDQYDTDAASIWGQYFSFPYYPSKYNSLQPAASWQNKIPIVQLQWAQRDPVLSYGTKIINSRQSFQANDYLNNGENLGYFQNLLNIYLNNKNTDFNQITIGLEAGQEGATFLEEFQNQINVLSNLKEVKIIKQSDFASWYKEKYPTLSPAHFLQKGDSFWYMSPRFRVGIFKEESGFKIKDFRVFNNEPRKEDFFADSEKFLTRRNISTIDQIEKNNEIDLGTFRQFFVSADFDHLTVNADNKVIYIGPNGISVNNIFLLNSRSKIFSNNLKLNLEKSLLKMKYFLYQTTSILVYSKINGTNVFGVKVSPTQILGMEFPKMGILGYNFQSLSKFKSPGQIIQKWKPWII